MFVIPTMMVITDGGVTHKLELKKQGTKTWNKLEQKKPWKMGGPGLVSCVIGFCIFEDRHID